MAFYAILIISKVRMHLTNLKISVIHLKKHLVLQGHIVSLVPKTNPK
jgi:hypothetical protein